MTRILMWTGIAGAVCVGTAEALFRLACPGVRYRGH